MKDRTQIKPVNGARIRSGALVPWVNIRGPGALIWCPGALVLDPVPWCPGALVQIGPKFRPLTDPVPWCPGIGSGAQVPLIWGPGALFPSFPGIGSGAQVTTASTSTSQGDQERKTGSGPGLYLDGAPFCSAIWRAPYFVSTFLKTINN
jgi:hypothetical protein